VVALRPVALALSAGVIDRTRALVLADGCWDLTEAQTNELLSEVLPKAAQVTATALAEQVRRVAVALDPGWAERRYKEAADALTRALAIDPGMANAHNGLGVAYAQLGQTTRAVEEWRRALELRPDFADARYNLERAGGNR